MKIQTKLAAHIKYYKYILSAVLIISTIFLSGDIFGGQDSAYLKKYFENAIFLYESSRYKEAILLFEKIIEAETAEGKFYFTPFAEIYIDKSKDKDVTLISQDKKPVRASSRSVSKKSDADYPGTNSGKENTVNNYNNMVDYYANKQKTTSVTAKSDNIKGKGIGIEPKKEKVITTNADEMRQDLLDEKLEEGLENLDQDTLKSFDDERFVDIVKRIKQYKKGKRGK